MRCETECWCHDSGKPDGLAATASVTGEAGVAAAAIGVKVLFLTGDRTETWI
jgi:hypothetical protein